MREAGGLLSFRGRALQALLSRWRAQPPWSREVLCPYSRPRTDAQKIPSAPIPPATSRDAHSLRLHLPAPPERGAPQRTALQEPSRATDGEARSASLRALLSCQPLP